MHHLTRTKAVIGFALCFHAAFDVKLTVIKAARQVFKDQGTFVVPLKNARVHSGIDCWSVHGRIAQVTGTVTVKLVTPAGIDIVLPDTVTLLLHMPLVIGPV